MVQIEINKRVESLTKFVNSFNIFKKEGFKIKPDNVSYDEKGAKVSETWSKGQLDKKKKFEEKIVKAEKAFDAAILGDFSKLDQVINELKVENKPNDKQEVKAEDEAK